MFLRFRGRGEKKRPDRSHRFTNQTGKAPISLREGKIRLFKIFDSFMENE